MRARSFAAVAAIVMAATACSPAASVAPSSGAPSVAATSAAPSTSASTSPSAAASGRPSVLRAARIADFLPSIFPTTLGTGNQELMADLVFNRLVDVDKDEVTILPSLATSWDASADATTYTFHLDPRAVWSDGQPANADDVIFTISWAAQAGKEAFKQLGVEEWFNVKGADAVKGTTTIPEGLKKVDDHTVTITLAKPDSTFLRRIAGAVYYILPQHILKDLTPAQSETCDFCLGVAGKTIGTGPYDFTESISATGATLTAKKGYWQGRDSQIDQIIYKIQESNVSVAQLAAGELDLVIRVPPEEGPGLESTAGLKQLNVPGVGIFAIDFNAKNTDKAMRQAIAYAVNRQETIDKVLGGKATLNQTIPPGFKVYDSINKYEFNVDKAKQLLAQSAFKDRTFRLAYLANDPNFTITAPALKQYLEDIGLKVELTALDTTALVDLTQKTDNWDGNLAFGGSEGVGWYQSQQYYSCPGLGVTNLHFSPADCIYDDLFNAAAAVTGDAQDKALEKIALALNENLPEIYFWQPNYLHVYSDRLGGGFAIYPNERESFKKILDWTYAP
jgi:peptide/nickel transport system substrate-binding protein